MDAELQGSHGRLCVRGCVGERQVVIWKDETHKPCCKREVQADALLQRNITTGPAAVLFSETGVSLYESQIPKGV